MEIYVYGVHRWTRKMKFPGKSIAINFTWLKPFLQTLATFQINLSPKCRPFSYNSPSLWLLVFQLYFFQWPTWNATGRHSVFGWVPCLLCSTDSPLPRSSHRKWVMPSLSHLHLFPATSVTTKKIFLRWNHSEKKNRLWIPHGNR